MLRHPSRVHGQLAPKVSAKTVRWFMLAQIASTKLRATGASLGVYARTMKRGYHQNEIDLTCRYDTQGKKIFTRSRQRRGGALLPQ